MEFENKKKLKTASSLGFTLMEVMFSVAILSLGIVASFSLIASSMASFSSATNKIIASNLAQDGIERTRNVRDTNWRQEDDWDKNIEGANPSNKTIKFFCGNNTSENRLIPSSPATLNDCGEDCRIYIYTKDISGEKCYSDDFGNRAGYNDILPAATNFYRLIRLDKKIDANGADYIEVVVYIKWARGGQNYILPSVAENLYDWK